MKMNKERQKAMAADKQALASTLSLTQEELQKSKVRSLHHSPHQSILFLAQEAHEESMTKIQLQMKEARRVIESLEQAKAMAVAEAKQQAHGLIAESDAALQSAREALASTTAERDQLQDHLAKLEKKGESSFVYLSLISITASVNNRKLCNNFIHVQRLWEYSEFLMGVF
jgi:hypothetical protein